MNDDAHCRKLVGSLYQLLDGEVTEDQVQYLSEHLAECGACLERLGVEMHFTLLVRSRCQETPCCPDHVIVNIRTALQAEVTG
ncbi:MAG TPA: zf-HC2 domain-containing protein [Actinomycetota bacterium]|nr:zf-HC2 domain-containing protein [Actinomycetota bacterium]